MRDSYRWGLATGLAATLALLGNARAQTPSQPSSPSEPGATRSSESQTGQPSGMSGMTGTQEKSAATPETPGTATATTGEKAKIGKKLSDDLERLHAVNQAEIHMGEMAEQQGQSDELKQYGRKLAADHKKLDDKLQTEASSLGVNLEGQAFQKAQKDAEKSMQKLQTRQGADFDKEFVSMAEKDHAKDRKDVEKAAKEARKEKQESIAKLLTQADAGMKGHLDEAKRLKSVVSKEGTRRQGRRGAAGGSTSTETAPAPATPSGGMGSSGAGTAGQGESHGTGSSGSTGTSGSGTKY